MREYPLKKISIKIRCVLTRFLYNRPVNYEVNLYVRVNFYSYKYGSNIIFSTYNLASMSVSLLISKPIIKQKYIFGSYYTQISVSSQISLADSLSYLCIEYILQDV